MIHVKSLVELKEVLSSKSQHPLALVPTMGALHSGHAELVRYAKSRHFNVALSIFVNPMQFGPGEDLDRYPRPLSADLDLCEKEGVSLVFTPNVSEMVSENSSIRVTHPVGSLYCGAYRPGHFDGVLTIVSKLLHLFSPDIAVFGQKDRQQLFLIERMVEELDFPLKIESVKTVREYDGLAKSSRNRYLSESERLIAPFLYSRLLKAKQEGVPKDSGDQQSWLQEISKNLTTLGFRPDYVSLVDRKTFLPPTRDSSGLILLAAAWLGKTRLIDNLEMDE
ncbi:MAG: pantoate--beta-alanine ligase [Leptospirillum sp.]